MSNMVEVEVNGRIEVYDRGMSVKEIAQLYEESKSKDPSCFRWLQPQADVPVVVEPKG